MSRLKTRLKKRWDMTRSNWTSDCRFSKKYAVLRIADDFSWRIGLKKLSDRIHSKKEQWILDYLKNMLMPVIEKYKDIDNAGIKSENAPVWVCWWGGVEDAPQLVKQCIRSIKKNAGEHPVNIITQDTYSEYLEVPGFLMDRLDKREIGLAHFSDYLRVCLLEKYGGLWLDATMFCADRIPEEYFEYPVFTCKSPYRESRYLSDYQWVTFCLGGWKGNIFYRFLKDAFELYWKEKDTAIDYLFFDDLIWLADQYIPSVHRYLFQIPISNLRRDDLQAAMNEALPAEEFWNIVGEDTVFYKLSWREEYAKKSENGKESVFSYFERRAI